MRVAVALVTGQALLCAVIGWVTFGPPDPAPQAAAPVDPLAGQLTGPTPSLPVPRLPMLPTPSSTSRPATPSKSVRATGSPELLSATAPTRKPPKSAAPVATTTDQTMLDPPAPEVIVPNPVLTPTTLPSPVAEDAPCDPEGAEEPSADGVQMVCTRMQDGTLLWQIN